MEMLAGMTPNASVKGALSRGTIRNEDSLNETRDLLAQCGLPLSPAKRVVHVAGTKGKGSVCAYLERLLRVHGGMRTGLFTSPHLVSPRERIRINGKSLKELDFTETLFKINGRMNEDMDSKLNYFRMMLLMGWETFSAPHIDVAVIETGIGGRYDSTNVIETPSVCVITALALEHEDMLGKGIESIAWHKAGIMKPGVPVITMKQDPLAMRVLEEQSRLVGSPLMIVEPVEGLPWPMNQNAALAIAAFQLLCPLFHGTNVCVDTLNDVKWYGRQHIIQSDKTTWYLDGAHTVESIDAALQWLSKDLTMKPALVFYCGPDKDYKSLLDSLGTNWTQAFFIPPTLDASGTGGERQAEMASWFKEKTGIESVAAGELPKLNGPVFVTGSFYLVGRILSELNADLEQI